MAEWYCAPDGQQIGPFGEERLREMAQAGQIGPDDAVWSPGMAEWVPAGAISGLLTPLQAARWSDELRQPDRAIRLDYATPTTAELHPEPLWMQENEVGPFLKFGKGFSVNDAIWAGPAVASPRAIYLLKLSRHPVHVLAAPFAKNDDIRTCALFDLPRNVQAAFDLKSEQMSRGHDVVILRRDAISLIKFVTFVFPECRVSVRVGTDRFCVSAGMFSKGRVRTFLITNGWILNAQMTPTIAPIHGPNYGRPESARAPEVSLAKRIMKFILALIIVAAVITLKVACAMSLRGR